MRQEENPLPTGNGAPAEAKGSRMKRSADAAWTRSLNGRFGGRSRQETITDAGGRTLLVAKTRWLVLVAIAFYTLLAGSLFSLSDYGFFLTEGQFLTLLLSLAGIISYNTLYQFFYDRLASVPGVDYLQILLDLLFVTLLIHFSGGAASWLWPIYLIVTIESSILLNRRRKVMAVGVFGSLAYGLLLAAGYLRLLPEVSMPFVNSELHHDPLFLCLMWFWVSLLNGAMALIGPYLMKVIRREHGALKASEQRLTDFLDSANDLIFSFSREGKVLYANRAWKEAVGHDPQAGKLDLRDLMDEGQRALCLADAGPGSSIEGVLNGYGGRKIAIEGSLSCSGESENAAIWGVCRDVTERQQAQEKLYHLTHHDLLTGLPNRLLFIDRLQQAKALGKRLQQQMAVLFLDLDRFKIINDSLGHAVGDQVLLEVAGRLRECVREVDTVARMGGDEFTILVGNLSAAADLEKIARKILRELARPMQIEGKELFVSASIGISVFPQDDGDPLGLVKKADVAMYAAKSQGRNNYQFYSPAMDLDADKRLVLENSMRRALERDEFTLFYQPKVDIRTGRVISLEALVRWRHPELGLLPPGDFIPIAEENGLILPIGEWVIRQACQQNRLWQKEGLPKIPIAVNLSGHQLQQKDLITTVRSILQSTELEPRYLELEVTETVIMQNPDFAAAILNELRAVGIRLAIDDFGTGYSSLAHLKRFCVDSLKIDKSFVRDVDCNSTDAAITSAIIAMGASLNMEVIAEGVEREGQLSFLRKNLCNTIQGYLFSQPVPPEEIRRLLYQFHPAFAAPMVTVQAAAAD